MWFRARCFWRKSLLHSYKKLYTLILLSAKILKHVGGSHHRETGRSFQKQNLQQKEKEAGRYFIYSKAWLHLFKRSSNERKHKQRVSILHMRSYSYTSPSSYTKYMELNILQAVQSIQGILKHLLLFDRWQRDGGMILRQRWDPMCTAERISQIFHLWFNDLQLFLLFVILFLHLFLEGCKVK